MPELGGVALLRVLIVEDHPVDSLHLRLLLEEIGCRGVQAVSDAHSALKLLESQTFDVIFSDISMEEGDGAILAVEMLRLKQTTQKELPALIWVSSLPEELLISHARLASDAGIPSVQTLRKPANLADCRAALLTAVRAQATLARNQIAPVKTAASVSDQDISAALLNANEIRIVLQPQVDLETRQIVAAEALVRWTHPTQGQVPPSAFIPAIERLKLDLPLFQCVLGRVIDLLTQLHQQGRAVPISVNASASTLSAPDFARDLARRMERAKLPSRLLRIELTEEVPIADLLSLSGCLNQLRVRGFELAIDDFGVGISTMKLLTQLPFSELKIDREFVSRMHTDPVSRVIVSAAFNMGETLGWRVVAEGIESEHDVEALKGLGGKIGQGFGLHRPQEVDAFTALMMTQTPAA